MQAGTRSNLSVLCKRRQNRNWNDYLLIRWIRRTYGRNTGEDIREGYEPTDDASAVGPEGSEGEIIGSGSDDECMPDRSEESPWKQAREPEIVLKPKYGLEGEEFENVWGGGEPSEPARENP